MDLPQHPVRQVLPFCLVCPVCQGALRDPEDQADLEAEKKRVENHQPLSLCQRIMSFAFKSASSLSPVFGSRPDRLLFSKPLSKQMEKPLGRNSLPQQYYVVRRKFWREIIALVWHVCTWAAFN